MARSKKEFAVTPYQSTSDRLFNPYFNQDPNLDVKVDIAAWQKKSLYLHKTSSIVAGATQNAIRFMLGSGLYPKITINSGLGSEKDYEIKSQLEDLWYKWSKQCGINGESLSSIMSQTWGEIFIWGDVLIYATSDDYSDIPIKLDLIPSISIFTPAEKEAIQGVKVKSKKIVGYYIKSENAKGWEYVSKQYPNGDFSSVLLKSPAKPYRIGQVRGEPLIASALNDLKDVEALKKANVKSAIYRNKTLGVITTPNSNDIAAAQKVQNQQRTIESSEDGNLLSLKPGESYTQHSGVGNQDPSFPLMVKEYVKLISGAYGLPPAILFNDLTDLSFSSSRTLLGMAWDSMSKYHDYLSDSLLIPVFKLLIKWAIETNQIDGLTIDMIKDFEFVYKPISQLKLKEQYEANQLALATGAKSEIQIAAENGEDAFQIAREQIELEAFKLKLRKENGLSNVDQVQNTEI